MRGFLQMRGWLQMRVSGNRCGIPDRNRTRSPLRAVPPAWKRTADLSARDLADCFDALPGFGAPKDGEEPRQRAGTRDEVRGSRLTRQSASGRASESLTSQLVTRHAYLRPNTRGRNTRGRNTWGRNTWGRNTRGRTGCSAAKSYLLSSPSRLFKLPSDFASNCSEVKSEGGDSSFFMMTA